MQAKRVVLLMVFYVIFTIVLAVPLEILPVQIPEFQRNAGGDGDLANDGDGDLKFYTGYKRIVHRFPCLL